MALLENKVLFGGTKDEKYDVPFKGNKVYPQNTVIRPGIHITVSPSSQAPLCSVFQY